MKSYPPSGFNPRARTGRDGTSDIPWGFHRRFNPRARTGRDQDSVLLGLRSGVSIHAPVRGATIGQVVPVPSVMFQSTRPYGARPTWNVVERWACRVSIHAPVRGATAQVRQLANFARRFNPRARTGRDQSLKCGWPCATGGFNPRARTGRDGPPCGDQNHRQSFNPRARTGRDAPIEFVVTFVTVFQSTRPYGARHAGKSCIVLTDSVSIHAPVRGATA